MTARSTAFDTAAGRLFGWLSLAMIILQVGRETTDLAVIQYSAVACVLVIAVVLAVSTRGSVLVFVGVAILLTHAAILTDPDWHASVWKALLGTGFFIAFFSAQITLRNAAGGSPSMAAAGTYLALQPPGRRYLALTAGAQAFAIVLNYGAIQLLGTLALSSARSEPDQRIREIRTRRMLLAIQRGFISSLPWSPLSFSIAIAVAVIPGTSWSALAIPGLVSSAIILGTGWALDTLFKPASSGAATRPPVPTGRWTTLLPVLVLLGLMVALLLPLELLLHIRVVGLVLIIVPLLSFVWILIQTRGGPALAARVNEFLSSDMPGFRKEILLIASAGYIGSLGSGLAAPLMAQLGLDLTALPVWLLLLGLFLALPVLGQLGANPILSMSLIAPLLPPAEALGISPTALALPLVCGWTMTGITSPFTATTLLIARFGGIRAIQVGWVWNRGYFLATSALLLTWLMLVAFLLGA